jgi:phenylacetate-CoA ligase
MRKALEIAREKVFWCNDALKGAAFRRHYDEIARNLTAVEQDVSSRNLRKLTSLLNHATSSVPFYHGISAGANLEDFPIVSKTTIRENFNAFISNAFTEEQQIATVTSGSTGTPFKVLQHRDKKIRNQADTLYFARLTGYRVGDRLLYLKIWSDNNRKSQWANLLQNMVPVDVISFNDSEVARLVDNMQRDGSTYAMLGYSSAIEQICRWLDKVGHGPVRTKLSSAISMSETLNDYTKQTIQKYFGAPVYSRYSNLENGILAQQITGSDSRYLINTASYVIEVVKMTNETPASPGELGRIVVTDLYNRLMPMIRYDTGDIGALSESSDAYGNRYLDLV